MPSIGPAMNIRAPPDGLGMLRHYDSNQVKTTSGPIHGQIVMPEEPFKLQLGIPDREI